MVALSSKSNTGFISGSFPLQMCHFPSYSVTEHFWKLLPCYETLNSGRCSSLLGQMQTAHLWMTEVQISVTPTSPLPEACAFRVHPECKCL